VIIATLLQSVADNPTNSFSEEKGTIIKNPGQSDMEFAIKDEHRVERFEAKGEGVKAVITCRTGITSNNVCRE
jgi:hypothetical protein